MRPTRPLKIFNTLSAERWTIVSQCWDLVSAVFKDDPTKREWWFRAVNPHLGNTTPIELILRGREQKLLEFIKACVEENKIE